MTKLIGWIVDAQRDFMEPTGALYVPGAAAIHPTLEATALWLREQAETVVYTADKHTVNDEEIASGQYPPHCLVGTYGADVVLEAAAVEFQNRRMETLAGDGLLGDAYNAAYEAAKNHHAVLVTKRKFDVFAGNPWVDTFLTTLCSHLTDGSAEPPVFVVCGVATDVCVKAAVEGLLDRGYKVAVVQDACAGLGTVDENDLMDQWFMRGAVVEDLAPLRVRFGG